MKRCNKCGLEKSLDQFYASPNSKDGHSSRCKDCISKDNAAKRAASKRDMDGEPMIKTLGQVAYEAYAESRSYMSYDGKELPQWGEQRLDLRQAWENAARAVERIVEDRNALPNMGIFPSVSQMTANLNKP